MLRHSYLIVAVATACSSGATTVHLAVSSDPSWRLDNLEIQIGTSSAEPGQAVPELDVQVADALSGQPQTIAVWGLMAGTQVAYGSVQVTPEIHTAVDAVVRLGAVDCGAWCTLGDIACVHGTGDSTITCSAQDNGCVAWSQAAACPSATPYCSDGACAGHCTDECTAGQTECDSGVTMRTCMASTIDSCMVWSAPAPCAAASQCTNNVCEVQPTCSGCTAPANADPTCTNGACDFTCHAGYARSGSSCVAAKLVFTTQAVFPGNLGGLAGADAKCQAAATAASRTGTFKAWLSDSNTNAGDRLSHATTPYALVDGTVVAASWTALTSGSLAHAIDESEAGGASVMQDRTWTATIPSGLLVSPNCSDWSTSVHGTSTSDPAHYGYEGEPSQSSEAWTCNEADSTPHACLANTCDLMNHLYCIQQ